MGQGEASLITIVVGTSLLAERRDRPLAYKLRERVLRALEVRRLPAEVTVIADTLYLRDESLHGLLAIAVGPPTDNAVAALAESRLPVVFEVDRTLVVRADLDLGAPLAACWGATGAHTARAIDAFVDRYLAMLLDRWVGDR